MKKSKKTNKTVKSTYDVLVDDPEQKKLLEQEYQELLLSELLLATMKRDQLSVRKLAAEAGVSPTIIQELRVGKRTNITLATFNRVLDAIGYQIAIEPKGR